MKLVGQQTTVGEIGRFSPKPDVIETSRKCMNTSSESCTGSIITVPVNMNEAVGNEKRGIGTGKIHKLQKHKNPSAMLFVMIAII